MSGTAFMKICLYLFEDDDYEHFYPLTYNRPVYLLLCGILPIWQKWQACFPDADLCFLCRNEIAEYINEITGIKCNRFDFAECDRAIFVNGRTLPSAEIAKSLKEDEPGKLYLTNGNLTATTIKPDSGAGEWLSRMNYWGYGHFKSIIHDLPKQDIGAEWLNYIWDFVAKNARQIELDYANYPQKLSGFRRLEENQERTGYIAHNSGSILMAPDAAIEGHVVLDAREGPIVIAENAQVGSHTSIEGPCYIGPETRIVGARLRGGSSFGPNCRVGGEVEESVFLGYSNKYHEGFMGHAYLGEWVNLGALTTNSDLKNNYGTIRVDNGLGEIDTGLLKVGSFLGDHTKTGIGMLLNTGLVLGFAANIFGGGLIKEKFVPSYTWGGAQGYSEYKLDKAVETASIVMQRRGLKTVSYTHLRAHET